MSQQPTQAIALLRETKQPQSNHLSVLKQSKQLQFDLDIKKASWTIWQPFLLVKKCALLDKYCIGF